MMAMLVFYGILGPAVALGVNSGDDDCAGDCGDAITKIEQLHEDLKLELQSNADAAAEAGRAALELATEVGSREHVAESLYLLGVAYYFKGYYSASNRFYDETLAFYLETGDDERIEALYNNMGVNYSQLSDNEKSAAFYSKSLEYAKQRGDAFGVAQTELNIGLLYHDSALYDLALEYTERAKAYFESAGDKLHIGLSNLNLGLIYYADANHQKSLSYLETARDIFRAEENVYNEFRAMHNIGTLYMETGNSSEALAYYEAILETGRDYVSVNDLANIYTNLSILWQQKGEFQKALGFLTEADDISYTHELPFQTKNHILDTYIEIYLDTERPELVRRTFEEKKQLQQEYNDQTARQAVIELDIVHNLSMLKEKYMLQTEQVATQRTQIFVLLSGLLLLSIFLGIILVLRKDVKEKSVVIKFINSMQREQQLQTYAKPALPNETRAEEALSERDEVGANVRAADAGTRNELKKEETRYSRSSDSRVLFNNICSLLEQEKLYLDANLRIEQLAKMLHSNSKYISNAVNQETGLNFSRFVNLYRIEEAKKIMNASDNAAHSLADIAFMAGFKNESTFYRNFKELMLTTPSEYRRTGVGVSVPEYIKIKPGVKQDRQN